MKSGLRAMGALRPDAPISEEPVALEIAVVATGARPGEAGAKRELFSEETQTVLIFEMGAVIRLSAGVADGQLLFLTNKKSGREVVTQVVRKRSFRPTSCYVDLEFTEASPDFWGIEFPKSAPVLPSQVASDSSDEEEGDSVKDATPPDLMEVERLKKEVSELQNQLRSLTGSTPVSNHAAVASDTVVKDSAVNQAPKQQHEESLLAQLIAQESQQEELHGPKRLVAYPKKSTSSVVKAASKAARIAAFAAVIVAVGIAAFRLGLFDSFITRSTAAKPAASSVPANLNHSAAPTLNIGKPVVAPGKSAASAATQTAPSASTAQPENSGDKRGSGTGLARAEALPSALDAMSKEGNQRRGGPSKDLAVTVPAAGIVPASGSAHGRESGNATAAEDYVAPKLIYSVKPVSPPEALRNYVTGNVTLDALIDATGHVKSVTVLSGPQKLRNAAIAEMKQYVYEPARENGKPVTAHVQASLKYWYEP